MKKAGSTKMSKSAEKLPKASLGTIVKSVKTLLGMGNKVAKTTKKIAKTVKKSAKTYGDNKAYGRSSDMKKSEFYRDRHNAGKTYNESGSNKGKLIATGATLAGLAAANAAKSKSKSNPTPKKK
jgi:hypothetical protein